MNKRIRELLNEATSGFIEEGDPSKTITVSDLEMEVFAISVRKDAFEEIAIKIKSMPFSGATIDSFLIWLKEQE